MRLAQVRIVCHPMRHNASRDPLATHGTKDPPTPTRSPLRTGFAPLHGGSNRA